MSIATSIARQGGAFARDRWPAAIWHPSAPRAVQKAYASGDDAAGWTVWRRHLERRKRPLPPSQAVGGNWMFNCGLSAAELSALFLLQRRPGDGRPMPAILRQWLDETTAKRWTPGDALSALAWCHALPGLAAALPADAWWQLLFHLARMATDAGAADSAGQWDKEPLVEQLVAGELALTLAYLFPELTVSGPLAAQAAAVLSAGAAELLDDRGLPHARHLDRLPLLLACWTRSRILGRRLRKGGWPRAGDKPYRRLLRSALRLARRDGAHVFSDSANGSAHGQLLAAAAALGGRPKDRRLAELLLGGNRKWRRGRAARLPAAALHSEWAATAVLRPDWSPTAPRLTVLYPDATCRMELSCGKDVLWSGVWTLNVQLDGEPLLPASPWDAVCWVSDDDADYLELEIELAEGLRVQRQMLLARRDRFLLLADAVLSERPAEIGYRGALPLSAATAWREACETREGVLAGGKPRAMLVPLALPEWLADCRGGELVATAAGLELRQAATGRALWAPLFFDLDRGRLGKPLTWRSLSVAEAHVVQPPDVAVGYRVAIGRSQWLLYRSLAPPQSRSLLGYNVRSETLVARFDRRGEVEPLVEVE
jgi:hypothetical protein